MASFEYGFFDASTFDTNFQASGGKSHKEPELPAVNPVWKIYAEQARLKAEKERTALENALAKASNKVAKKNVVFEPSKVSKSMASDLAKKMAQYEKVANEMQVKTKQRLAKLAQERDDEEIFYLLMDL